MTILKSLFRKKRVLVSDENFQDLTEKDIAVCQKATELLAIVCSENREYVIDLLTSYLWDAKTAEKIKSSV